MVLLHLARGEQPSLFTPTCIFPVTAHWCLLHLLKNILSTLGFHLFCCMDCFVIVMDCFFVAVVYLFINSCSCCCCYYVVQFSNYTLDKGDTQMCTVFVLLLFLPQRGFLLQEQKAEEKWKCEDTIMVSFKNLLFIALLKMH